MFYVGQRGSLLVQRGPDPKEWKKSYEFIRRQLISYLYTSSSVHPYRFNVSLVCLVIIRVFRRSLLSLEKDETNQCSQHRSTRNLITKENYKRSRDSKRKIRRTPVKICLCFLILLLFFLDGLGFETNPTATRNWVIKLKIIYIIIFKRKHVV